MYNDQVFVKSTMAHLDFAPGRNPKKNRSQGAASGSAVILVVYCDTLSVALNRGGDEISE